MCNFLWKFTMFSRDFSLQHFSLVCMWTVVNRQFNWRLFYFQCKCNEFSLLFPIRQIFCWLEMSCLLCFIVYFHYQQNRKNRHLSQSHRTQQMRKYHAIREIFLHQLDYIRSSQWRRGGRKERNVCIRWLYPSMWFFAWMRFVREHTHTHMARHTSISDTEAEKKTHKRLI